jgi:hypothetical protein
LHAKGVLFFEQLIAPVSSGGFVVAGAGLAVALQRQLVALLCLGVPLSRCAIRVGRGAESLPVAIDERLVATALALRGAGAAHKTVSFRGALHEASLHRRGYERRM